MTPQVSDRSIYKTDTEEEEEKRKTGYLLSLSSRELLMKAI